MRWKAAAGTLGLVSAAVAVTLALTWPWRPGQAATGVRWLAVGGGPDPASNQVSMEQDIELAARVLGPRGRVLFAGGPGASGVQELDPVPRGDELVHRLGELFSPRGGRDARYRPIRVAPAARSTDFLVELRAALADGKDPLLVFVAAHGDRGETEADAAILVWGGWTVHPVDIAEALDAASDARAVRFVIASCHSGGFADLLFAGADPEAGAAPGVRCGLFSTTWEREASGCDPNPDRAAQESYALHFLGALRDRRARTLLDAHTHARITSRSIDVPTTTSERWLRAAAPAAGEGARVNLPEEQSVIRALSARLGMDESAARTALDQYTPRLAAVEAERTEASAVVEDAYRALAADMLGRWPVIDDPYHPDYPATLAAERAAITEYLATSPAAGALADAEAALREIEDRRAQLLVESAPIERLVRAHDNLLLAGRLAAAGGRDWQVFERLRACERGAP